MESASEESQNMQLMVTSVVRYMQSHCCAYGVMNPASLVRMLWYQLAGLMKVRSDANIWRSVDVEPHFESARACRGGSRLERYPCRSLVRIRDVGCLNGFETVSMVEINIVAHSKIHIDLLKRDELSFPGFRATRINHNMYLSISIRPGVRASHRWLHASALSRTFVAGPR